MIPTARKVLTGLIHKRIVPIIEASLPPEQYGFRPHRSTHMPLEILISDVKRVVGTRGRDTIKKGSAYCAFIDFKKAFDSVNRVILLEKLIDFKVKGRIFYLIKSLLQANVLFIDDGVETSDEVLQAKGVPQGDRLSPTLFLIYIAELRDKLLENNLRLQCLFFADDLVFYSEDRTTVQQELDTVYLM